MTRSRGEEEGNYCSYNVNFATSLLTGKEVGFSFASVTAKLYNCPMAYIWDYDPEKLAKSEQGQIKLLERAINFGPEKGEKIELSKVKRYWDRLKLFPRKQRLFKLLIWGK